MKYLRFYHLLFGAAVATAWFSAESTDVFHAWAGYTVAALLLVRFGLGFARQTGFRFSRLRPRFGTPPRGQTGLRHPAIGAVLTLLLFVGIVGVAGTGVAMDRGGTLVGQSIRLERAEHREHGPEARAPREEEHEEEGALAEVHHTMGKLLLPLAILHILWIVLARWDMARFMLLVPRRRGPAQA